MATTKLMTAEDLWQLEDDEHRYDLMRGELIRMSPAGRRHGKIGALVLARVWLHVDLHHLGEVYNSETGFILVRDPDVVLAPDVAFVGADRLPPEDQQEGFLNLAPDLAVEIVSPSDRSRDVTNKVIEYLDAGVRLVWVIEPSRKVVSVYTPDRKSEMLTVDDELLGSEVLPGFTLPIAEIFD